MIRCAIVDTSTGNVVNVIEYETVPSGTPPGFPDGHIAVASDTAGPGFSYNASTGVFTDNRPPLPPPPPTPPTGLEEAQRANARLDAGVLAALDVAIAVKTAMASIPDTFSNANYVASKIQLDALTEAVVSMLQGQAALTDKPKPPAVKPP